MFCTDYRKVNKVTKADSYPLPQMGDCVDLVGSAKFVNKFDLLKRYWQVHMTVCAQEISAFVTPFGLDEYTVMSFGNATFQRLMNLVMAKCEFVKATVACSGRVGWSGAGSYRGCEGSGNHAVPCACY